MDSIPLKQCSKCKEWFPRTHEFFPFRKEAPDGLRGMCFPCYRTMKRQTVERSIDHYKATRGLYYDEHKDYLLKKNKEWREANPERVKANRDKWRSENYERVLELNNQSNARHRDKINARSREYYNENKEKCHARGKNYYQRNTEKVLVRTKRNRNLKPEVYNLTAKLRHQRRKARKVALPDTFTQDDWQKALDYFDNQCAVCGRRADFWTKLAMDHWIPLSNPSCPGTVAKNIVPLCNCHNGGENPAGKPPCNQSKHGSLPEAWLVSRYGKRKAKQILERIQAYFDQLE